MTHDGFVAEDGSVSAMAESADTVAGSEFCHTLAYTSDNAAGLETQKFVGDLAHANHHVTETDNGCQYLKIEFDCLEYEGEERLT